MLKLNCVIHPPVSAEKDTQLDDNLRSVRIGGNVAVYLSVIRCGSILHVF